MKSQEQRIEDAAAAISARITVYGEDALLLARNVLEAADREPPKWPTDESLAALNAATHDGKSSQREIVRAAFLADPIVKAAIELRRIIPAAVGQVGPNDAQAVQAVIDAVNEAGL
jgi:hypothetical protein